MTSSRSDIEGSVLLQHQDDLHVAVNNYDEVLRSLPNKRAPVKNELSLSDHLRAGIQLRSLLRSRNADNSNVNGEHRDSQLTREQYVHQCSVVNNLIKSLISHNPIRLLLKKTLEIKKFCSKLFRSTLRRRPYGS